VGEIKILKPDFGVYYNSGANTNNSHFIIIKGMVIITDVIKVRKTVNRLAEIITGKEQSEQPV
jgi:hypothetical protein